MLMMLIIIILTYKLNIINILIIFSNILNKPFNSFPKILIKLFIYYFIPIIYITNLYIYSYFCL